MSFVRSPVCKWCVSLYKIFFRLWTSLICHLCLKYILFWNQLMDLRPPISCWSRVLVQVFFNRWLWNAPLQWKVQVCLKILHFLPLIPKKQIKTVVDIFSSIKWFDEVIVKRFKVIFKKIFYYINVIFDTP